jgi:hypothetical protein
VERRLLVSGIMHISIKSFSAARGRRPNKLYWKVRRSPMRLFSGAVRQCFMRLSEINHVNLQLSLNASRASLFEEKFSADER